MGRESRPMMTKYDALAAKVNIAALVTSLIIACCPARAYSRDAIGTRRDVNVVLMTCVGATRFCTALIAPTEAVPNREATNAVNSMLESDVVMFEPDNHLPRVQFLRTSESWGVSKYRSRDGHAPHAAAPAQAAASVSRIRGPVRLAVCHNATTPQA